MGMQNTQSFEHKLNTKEEIVEEQTIQETIIEDIESEIVNLKEAQRTLGETILTLETTIKIIKEEL